MNNPKLYFCQRSRPVSSPVSAGDMLSRACRPPGYRVKCTALRPVRRAFGSVADVGSVPWVEGNAASGHTPAAAPVRPAVAPRAACRRRPAARAALPQRRNHLRRGRRGPSPLRHHLRPSADLPAGRARNRTSSPRSPPASSSASSRCSTMRPARRRRGRPTIACWHRCRAATSKACSSPIRWSRRRFPSSLRASSAGSCAIAPRPRIGGHCDAGGQTTTSAVRAGSCRRARWCG